jgi:uncharacterized protein YicC (UPF0701 family)
MGFLDSLGKASLSALTTDIQLDNLRKEDERLKTEFENFKARQERFMERVDAELQSLKDRVLKLETLREADKRELQAEVARFKADVERFEARLSRQLPPSPDNN